MHMLAKALYDNIAESPDELAFKRGDVLSVIEQETGGLEGWWLCSLRGKQGIAPGNRLKLMTGLYANHARSQTADFPSTNQKTADSQWERRSWDGLTNKVLTPARHGDMFVYNQQSSVQSDYDVPPSRHPALSLNNSYRSNSSPHSSREELDTSLSNFERSLYDTPPQNRSMMSADSSMYDTPPSQLHLDPYDIPSGSVRTSLASKLSEETMSLSSGMSKSNPPSMCDSARSSMDITPLDMYDVPPSQREREAKMAGQYPPIRSSKDSGLDMYDSPPKLKSPPSMVDDYDVPRLTALEQEREKQFRSMNIAQSEPSSPGSLLEDYDVPKSSIGSKMSHLLKTSKSLEEQPGLEDYDVPKQNPTLVSGKSPLSAITPKRFKSNSLGSLLDDYDTPSAGSTKLSKDDLFTKLNQTAKDSAYTRQFSDDENNYDEPDAAVTKKVLDVKGVTLNQEHDVDAMYDTPKNNAPVKNMSKEFSAISIQSKPELVGAPYDIPPQVTRDSVISSRSDSSDGTENGNHRWSNSSIDSKGAEYFFYDELPLELDAANDLVIKLQQDVQKATQKFTNLSHSSWRKKENIDQKLYDIKQACLCLSDALGEFVDFGQGTLANSAKLSDRKLINKLSKYLIPLQQAHQQIRVNIKHLDDANWQISKHMSSSDSSKKDDLGMIASLAKDLSGDVRKLASFIQGNSSLLFKRAKDFNRSSRGNVNEHSSPVTAGKPPISRKPVLPAKSTPPTTVQARPLPAPPPSERPLPQPPTPTEKKPQGFGFSGPETKRLSGEYKHWSGEFQVKRLSVDKDTESTGVYKEADLVQEYDYVELEDENEKQTGDTVDGKIHKLKKGTSPNEHVEGKDLDSYENELEKTLDQINDVSIYSDDTGTLKRNQAKCEKDEDCEKGGTLKREKSNDKIDKCVDDICSDKFDKDSSEERDEGTLKRDTKLGTYDSVENVKQDINNEITQISSVKVTDISSDSVEVPVHDKEPVKQLLPLDPEDKQVLAFYREQFDTHSTLLTNSIDAFFNCIENNQAPKVFISHSKFVVVSAHKLVYIGDSLHRNLKHDQVRTRIIQSANLLCDCLKQAVVSTKTAALQYPSVPAVQDMVDRIVDVSRSAREFKLLVQQAAKL